ncbi:MAG: sulfatase, partial [Kiritimatiellaeota bacterium]|nr:sulfatase [Kiritimatiellota bacterium]
MKTRPNIVFILMDDLGWRDLACTGSTFYETPNLDRLASQGMMFTQAYAACPVCSPTRASVMSGKYPARLGVTDWIDNNDGSHPCRGVLVDAPYVKQLNLSERSVARSLREDGGYATWHIGKWHLGREPYWPTKHGFDVNIGGCHWGAPWRHGYFSPWNIPGLPNGEPGEYLPDHLTDKAIELIRNRDTSKPFFLNFWDYCVHMPIHAKPEKIEKYRRKAAALGLDTDGPGAFAEGEVYPTEQRRHMRVTRRVVQSDPAYAAMIESVDENVGRLMAVLEEQGIADNTLVIFTSDNGGESSVGASPTSNLPLAEGKGWMYEGGTREPLLVRFPGVVEPGSRCDSIMTSPDFYPTFLEVAGLPPRPEQHMDGVSLVPLFKGDTSFNRGAVFWHYPHYGNQGGTPGSSVREGDWKLIEFFEDGRLELYNLRDDPSESQNVAAAQPG